VCSVSVLKLSVRLIEILSVLSTLLCGGKRNPTHRTLGESDREWITLNGWVHLLIFLYCFLMPTHNSFH
jgi:hypothetical protein